MTWNPRWRQQSALTYGILFAGCFVLGAFGCSPGIRWYVAPMPDARAESARRSQLMFVYFRNWYEVDCTRFEEEVLKLSEVRSATSDMVCVPLAYDWDKDLAAQFAVGEPPAVVILTPDGEVAARLWGNISKEKLVQAINDAKQEFRPTTQDAPPS